MRLTSLPPPIPSNSTQNANTQAETLNSLCNWWMNTKEEALPGICHWFIHQQKNQRRFSLKFEPNQSSTSLFSPFGYSGNVGMTTMEHPVSFDTSISLILILGSVLFIVLVTAFITCITRKKQVQVLFLLSLLDCICIFSATQ